MGRPTEARDGGLRSRSFACVAIVALVVAVLAPTTALAGSAPAARTARRVGVHVRHIGHGKGDRTIVVRLVAGGLELSRARVRTRFN